MRPIDADALKMALSQSFNDPELVIDEAPLDCVPVRRVEWEWFEDWGEMPTSLLAPHDPPELFDYGWRCSHCKTYLREAVDVRNVWDDPDEKPVIKCCPECGAMMDGGKAK